MPPPEKLTLLTHFRFGQLTAALCLIGITLAVASAGLAETVTFAQVLESSTESNDFSFVNSGTNGVFGSKDPQTGSISIPVTFTLLSLPNNSWLSDLRGPQAAHLTFQIATDQDAAVSGNYFNQALYSEKDGAPQYGSIAITRDSPDDELHQTNLLTVSFYSRVGGLNGVKGGQTASLTVQNGLVEQGEADYVHFSSSYLDFTSDADENLAFSFTSATPCLSTYAILEQTRSGCAAGSLSTLSLLHSFTAAGTGSFAADPSTISDSETPEPRSLWSALLGWILIISYQTYLDRSYLDRYFLSRKSAKRRSP
jgi:hypothetical protein